MKNKIKKMVKLRNHLRQTIEYAGEAGELELLDHCIGVKERLENQIIACLEETHND